MEKEVFYAVQVSSSNKEFKPSGYYISDVNWGCWYETSNTPIFKFTKDEIEKLKNLFTNMFIYFVEIIGGDGSKESWSAFKECKSPTPQVKTSGLKITLKM